MEADWEEAHGCPFHVSELCEMEWGEEAERERCRQKRRKRPRQEWASAPFGGDIAMLVYDEPIGEEEEEDAAAAGFPTDGELKVYSSTGRQRFHKPWFEGKLVRGGFGWTSGGVLVCLLEAGDSAMLFHADSGGAPRVLALPNQQRLVCAHVWAGGFVAVTEGLDIVEGLYLGDSVRAHVGVRATLSPVLLDHQVPGAVTVLRPFVSRDNPELAHIVLANPSRAGIVVVEGDGVVRSQFAVSQGVATSLMLVPHPTYRLIASYGMDGVLSVLPMDFCEVLVQHNCHNALQGMMRMTSLARTVPQNVLWCGLSTFALCVTWAEAPWAGPLNTGSLILSMEHKFDLLSRAHLKGSEAVTGVEDTGDRTGDELGAGDEAGAQFSFRGHCFASSEVDGVRMIGFEKSFMIRQVPESYREMFRLGSTDPAAILMDTVEMLDQGDADADASLNALIETDKIGQAVEVCLDAAEHATSAEELQRHLVRVASFGKRFFHRTRAGLSSLKERRRLAKRFVSACKFFRICLVARVQGGVAVTTKQLRVMTPGVLLDRLLYHREFFVASQLSKDAGVPIAHVVTQWAMQKIRKYSHQPQEEAKAGEVGSGTTDGQNTDTESDLVEAIVQRVDACNKRLRAGVSFAAIGAVAASLGDAKLATRLAQREVRVSQRVLLSLRVQDYDEALIIITTEVGTDPDLQLFVISECVSRMSWERVVAACAKSPMVCDLVTRYCRMTDETLHKKLLLGLDQKRAKALVLAEESCMSLDPVERVRLMKEAGSEFKDAGQRGLGQLALEHAKLLERQNELGDSVVGLSLANTVLDCFRRGLDDAAEAFATDFGLPDRVFRKIQLRGLAARKAWGRIQELSYQQSVRAVLDGADFADAFANGGQVDEAIKQTRELSDTNERKAGLLVRLGLYADALEAAYNIGNVGALEAIRKRAPDMDALVREKLEQLSQTGPPIKPKQGKERAPLAALNAARDRAAQGCAQQ
ncbi:Protein VACUOLELESS1 (Vacuolar protein sorting-associated protein 16 homolog) [Durusdinium trenchii]|uniref:Protein VACUOLELESS1 (Vacuolar protein sorting-associated protein 16 homolog) n=1 Tax=Durusdinium trenchii TaxID=1381693 RepID=A0ABP0SJ19_9DINO